MAMSSHETLGGMPKKKPAMANSQPGSTSHPEETLGGKTKRKPVPAHVGHRSTSHPEETLGGVAKKKIMSGSGGGSNMSAGDAAGAI